jgi:hypothetical protein
MAILHKFKHPKKKADVIFEEDLEMDEDGWFISIKYVQKNGSLKREHCIIRKDVEQFVSMLIRDGYEEDK